VGSQRAALSVELTLLLFLAGCSSGKPPASAAAAASPPASTPQSCAFCPEQSPPDCTLCVASNPLLSVDKDGAASATLRLCNRGAAPAMLDLALSDFHSLDPGVELYPLSTVRTLSAVNAANSAIVAGAAPLPPGSCVDVKVDATKIWQAGLSVADLLDGRTKILQLKAIRYQVPFNVRVEGQTESGVNILFTRGSETSIRLRNDDELAYRLRWRLELADFDKSGEEFIPGHGLATIKVECPQTNFSLVESGFFRPATRVGTLTLQFAPGAAGFGVLPLPSKQFPVAARLSYYSDVRQRATNYVFILFVLLAGILLSLLVNQVLPAQRKRVAIKQRLADLEGRLAGFAGAIDSRLLSLLRLEKKRLRAELREQLPIFPQTSQELPKLEARIDWLVKRVDLTSRVGDLLNDIEMNQDDLAVSEVEDIRMHCREVLDVVRKPAAAADEIQIAQKHVQLAEGIRDRADDEPSEEAVRVLRERNTAVSARILKPLPADTGWAVCEDLLAALQKDLPPAAGTIDRVQFVRHSRVVRALELIVEFAELVDRSATQRVRTNRLARAPELRAALEPGPDASLVKAQHIVRQIEQNVTKADLLKEMNTPNTMHVEIDPPTPITYQLVTFRVRFDRPGFDSAVAQDEIACSWFINGSPVDGRDASVDIRVSDSDGRRVRGWVRGECFLDEGVEWLRLPRLAWRRLTAAVRRGPSEDSTTRGTRLDESVGWLRLPKLAWRRLTAAIGRSPSEDSTTRGTHTVEDSTTRGTHTVEDSTTRGTRTVEDSTTRGTRTVEARFPALPQVKVAGAVTIERTKSFVESRSILATTSLSITVLIVALGLLAGAQEKLQALDWLSGALAVLALGFGADTLKTLISRS
jgi:hypothetical protein